MTVSQLLAQFDQKYPLCTALDFDNVGLLVGDADMQITSVAVSLDATLPALKWAKQKGANLLLTHHPIIFKPVKALTSNLMAYAAAAQQISVMSLHTNLDVADGGVNDQLAKALGFTVKAPLCSDGLGRVCTLPHPLDDKQLCAHVKQALGSSGVRATVGKAVHTTVAVGGGACGDLIDQAMSQGATALITGEAKHSDFLYAAQRNFTLIAAGHFATEVVVLPQLLQDIASFGLEAHLCPQTDVEVYL